MNTHDETTFRNFVSSEELIKFDPAVGDRLIRVHNLPSPYIKTVGGETNKYYEEVVEFDNLANLFKDYEDFVIEFLPTHHDF